MKITAPREARIKDKNGTGILLIFFLGKEKAADKWLIFFFFFKENTNTQFPILVSCFAFKFFGWCPEIPFSNDKSWKRLIDQAQK